MNRFFNQAKFLFASSNFRKINHPVVCFDSDDWGSKKFSSQEQKNAANKKGYDTTREPFVRCDALETIDDIEKLAKVLLNHHDRFGNHPIFTLNFIMFNPDYDYLLANNFSSFRHTPFLDAYGDEKKQTAFLNTFKKYQNIIFDYQLHGAQHINVPRFLKDGKAGSLLVKDACALRVTNFSDSYGPKRQAGYMDELAVRGAKDTDFVISELNEASDYFEKCFGYRSDSITPSCGVISNKMCEKLGSNGFRWIKISLRHYRPTKDDIRSFISLKKRNGDAHFIFRNLSYDPEVNFSFKDFFNSFAACSSVGSPCIISSHRLNFASKFNAENVKHNLDNLDHLLSTLETNYPNLEYLSTEDCIRKYAKIKK